MTLLLVYELRDERENESYMYIPLKYEIDQVHK